jgi:hypothetical protein
MQPTQGKLWLDKRAIQAFKKPSPAVQKNIIEAEQ